MPVLFAAREPSQLREHCGVSPATLKSIHGNNHRLEIPGLHDLIVEVYGYDSGILDATGMTN
ncbi:MAG: hypothetical protein K8T89_05075, partial [Planctomycetes bacterium]|nr:hypothetical protein [Planctomycetota bacterium]